MRTRDLRVEIDHLTTIPDMVAITEPSIKSAKLSEDPTARYPQIYIPVDIHIDKPGGIVLALIVFSSLIGCSAINIAILFFHHIIIVR